MNNYNFRDDVPYQTAFNAYSGISFSPEKRAETVISSYAETMQSHLEQIKALAGDQWEVEFESFHAKAKAKYLNWMHAKSRCYSTMITGPANFNVRRNEKANRSEEKAGTEYYAFLERAIKSIKRKHTEDIDPLVKARKDLETREKNHELMKGCNKILKSKKLSEVEKVAELEALGLSSENALKLFEPDYAGRLGYASFELTNNNSQIKRLQQRVKMLESKEAKKGTDESIQIGELKIVTNYEADRYQLFFDGKPEADIRSLCKSHGFKWAPSQGAWQRKITGNASYVINRLFIPAYKELAA